MSVTLRAWRLLLLIWLFPQYAAAQDTLAATLEQLQRDGSIRVAGALVRNSPLLQSFYVTRGQRASWDGPASRQQLLAAVGTAAAEGLNPRDYHLAALQGSNTTSAAFDALRTDALIRLAAHLFHGKLDAIDYLPEIDLQNAELGASAVQLLEDAIGKPDIPALLERLTPHGEIYQRLKAGLAQYRAIEQRGGWGLVADGPTLHPGDRSPRVVALRERLSASADLRDPGPVTDRELFDTALAQATRHFQTRHQLDADGVVGKKTVTALNVPVSQRIDQIRINLERARWLLHDLPASYVLVDIAGFTVRYVQDGKELLRSRAVVGKPFRMTPIFRATMKYLEFNPTWTVPPTILRQDVLPQIRKNPGYLASKKMRVLTFEGKEVNPASVDWSRYQGKNLPYLIRQDPGPDNALGRVKFMFPNQHHVYLHDTPSRDLFRQSERAFSSGCIRVEEAATLAKLLLARQGWTPAQVEESLAGKRTRKVSLDTPVPVLLYYWTVAIEDDGDILFKRDIYQRDAKLLEALDELDGAA